MSKSKSCNVKSPVFKNGQHPNSMRHLTPCHSWTIHIDETGNQFSNAKTKSNEEERTGKLVALAIAQNVQLPELPKDFHAKDWQNKDHKNYNPKFLDEIINNILDNGQKIGVIGIQYNDSLAKSSPNWWSEWCGYAN